MYGIQSHFNKGTSSLYVAVRQAGWQQSRGGRHFEDAGSTCIIKRNKYMKIKSYTCYDAVSELDDTVDG